MCANSLCVMVWSVICDIPGHIHLFNGFQIVNEICERNDELLTSGVLKLHSL